MILFHFIIALILSAAYLAYNWEADKAEGPNNKYLSHRRSYNIFRTVDTETRAFTIVGIILVWEIVVPFALLITLFQKIIEKVKQDQDQTNKTNGETK